MLIFIDTEFTDFTHPELISIGLVTEDGQHEFYAELPVHPERCNDFVVKTVLPQLGKAPGAFCTPVQLKERLLSWLQPFASQSPTIGYDFNGDWQLLCHALDNDMPPWLAGRNIFPFLDPVKLQWFFSELGLQDHHALNDAKANRFAYDPTKVRADLPQLKKSR